MDSNNDNQDNNRQAWFIVSGSQDEEFFPPPHEAEKSSPESAIPEAAEPEIPVPETLSTGGSAEPDRAEAIAKDSRPTDQAALPKPVDPANGAVTRAQESRPMERIGNTESAQPSPRVSEVASTPERVVTPTAADSQRNGFTRSDLLRLGGSLPKSPCDRTGLLIAVQTPQRVRLGQIIPLKEPRTVLGRASGIGCFVDDTGVAEIHAVITYEAVDGHPGFVLYSSVSAPVSINDAPAAPQSHLVSGDRIALSNTELMFLEAKHKSEVPR